MQQLKIIIADDEPIARDILKGYIAKLPYANIVAECKNATEVFSVLHKEQVDLLLLDINMPEITGLDLLKTLRNPPQVIFTTAYAEYAVESYELNAIDYLLKPFSFDRFVKAINKVLEKETTTIAHQDIPNKTIFVKADGKLVKVNIDELTVIEGVKDYVKLWVDKTPLLVHSTMKNMEEQLQQYPDMVRVHKSYIVNIAHVNVVEGNILRFTNHEVVIGNTYRDKVFELLNRNKIL